jgi:Na+-transporting methylmalonyl-CoA/oxaloacetate decarboxylase gamma subunit
MPVEEMLSASVHLMLLGMGTVFCILGLLIVGIMLMSKWLASEAAAVPAVIMPGGEPVSAEHAAGVVAAIQAAVHVYRGAIDRKS